MSRDKLLAYLNQEVCVELSQLRTQACVGAAASKLAKIRRVRKSIAQAKTVLNQKTRTELKKAFKGKKHKPKDLRPKLTRAKRRALKPYEANKLGSRRTKQLAAFPKRKFAVRLE